MTRLLATAVGKLTNPNVEGSIPVNAENNEDYFFKVAILYHQVVHYEEYNPNPQYRYYKYKGPMIKVGIGADYERVLCMTFEEFDAWYTGIKTITVKAN